MMSMLSTPSDLAADGIQFMETGLILPERLPFDRWLVLGETLQRMEKSVMWWLGDWWQFGERKYGEMASQAARDEVKQSSGFAYETARQAGRVARRFESGERSPDLEWTHHLYVSDLEIPKEEALEWLERAAIGDGDPGTGEPEPWSARRLRAEVRSTKLHERLVTHPLPDGIFNVIYADPPWEHEQNAGGSFLPTEAHYPTMALADICALDVKNTAAEHAILFLWSTGPKLIEALEVIAAWDFEYRTCLTWIKPSIGMGFWARQRHELLLICRRGDFPTPRDEDKPDSVIEAPRGRHSEKPDVVYELIERMYPGAKYLELFARQCREGWTSWGNEIESPSGEHE